MVVQIHEGGVRVPVVTARAVTPIGLGRGVFALDLVQVRSRDPVGLGDTACAITDLSLSWDDRLRLAEWVWLGRGRLLRVAGVRQLRHAFALGEPPAWDGGFLRAEDRIRCLGPVTCLGWSPVNQGSL